MHWSIYKIVRLKKEKERLKIVLVPQSNFEEFEEWAAGMMGKEVGFSYGRAGTLSGGEMILLRKELLKATFMEEL